MGLAASQARFLAITSRKLNCEFQSMQIAQEKLSITREQQKAASEYQDALSATKLVWDTADNDSYDLNYDIMMKPSALNEYDPYLITDTQGKIVLSEGMFQAAVAAGIVDRNTGEPIATRSMGNSDGTSKTDGSRNAFLYQLGVQNQADASTIEAVMELGANGYTSSGVGGDIIDKTLAGALNTNSFINYMKEAEDAEGNLIYNLNLVNLLADTNGDKTISDEEYNSVICTTTSPSDTDTNKIIITKNGVAITDREELENLTLGDILDGKYEMTGTMNPTELLKRVEQVLTGMATILGKGESNDVKGLNVDKESENALDNAYEFTLALMNANQTSEAGGSIIFDSVRNAITTAQNTNNIVKGSNNISSVSLTNMLKSYLTYFAIAMEGYDYGLFIEQDSASKSSYVTDELNYYFIIKEDASITDQASLNADFYNQLYNQLCVNGACTDAIKRAQVTDSDYLNHALKNGQLFVSTLNNDGYFYQSHYTASAHIVEVTDDDAIAQAEAEYNVKKSELSYKEESLDLQMKNIDTELSALTTEYDTVKNLISKNVEKVFTMFST